MKRKILTAMSLLMIIAMIAVPVSAAKPVANRVPDTAIVTTELTAVNKVADLYAGQNTDVGDLFIDARGDNEYLVTYMLDLPDYYFGQIHFEAINDNNPGFTDDSAIIYSNGGVVPGKLTVKETFAMPVIDEITGVVSGGTREYSFIYTSGAPVDSFAAHSVVCLATTKTTQVEVVNGTDPVIGTIISDAGMPMVGGGLTVEVREPFGYPDETTLEYDSVWDDAFDNTPAFNNKIIANGAQIIWNALYSSGATPGTNELTMYGDVLKVNIPVTVPDNASNVLATLYIVTDNAYIAKIGDSLIGSAGFNAFNYAVRTSALELATTNDDLLLEIFPFLSARDPITQDALFIENVVDSAAWNTMITVATPVPLVVGVNEIEIAAMNEYMGPLDGQANGTSVNNPAGVIFFIEYAWDVPHMEWQDRYSLEFNCETAWGMGEDANGSNWSQIITEVPIEAQYTFLETVNVSSLSAAGINTTNILVAGQDYILRASGTYDYNNAGDWADVEWYLKSGVIVKGDTEGSTPYVLDVSIDGSVQNIDWGAYDSAHEYEHVLTGTGATARFFIYDSNYTDNSGSIIIDIYVKNW